MATKLVRCCGFCNENILRGSNFRLTSPKSHFYSLSILDAKSTEEIQADDMRASLDSTGKRGVKDYSVAELREISDIARLPRQLRSKLSTREELMPPVDKNAASIEKQRMIYAKLGQKSGLPPGIMWPTRSQVKFTMEDEKTYFATLQELIRFEKDKKTREKEEHEKKQAEITACMNDMPSLIAEFEAKLNAQRAEEKESMKRKSEMLEEAREFFGYAIQENDDRIVKFLEQKEQSELERVKAEKKAQRLAEAKKNLEDLARRATAEAMKAAEQDAEERKADLATTASMETSSMEPDRSDAPAATEEITPVDAEREMLSATEEMTAEDVTAAEKIVMAMGASSAAAAELRTTAAEEASAAQEDVTAEAPEVAAAAEPAEVAAAAEPAEVAAAAEPAEKTTIATEEASATEENMTAASEKAEKVDTTIEESDKGVNSKS